MHVFLIFVLSSCSEKKDVFLDYSKVPEYFELGAEMPDLKEYIELVGFNDNFEIGSFLSSNLNTQSIGEYVITIDLTSLDIEDYNELIEIKVSVKDTQPPRIIKSNQNISVVFGEQVDLSNFDCEDQSECRLSFHDFEYLESGDNIGLIKAIDASGNYSEIRLKYEVVDINYPEITILEDRYKTPLGYFHKLGNDFELPIINVTDIEDESPIVTISNQIDVDSAGTYTLTVTAIDNYGNSTVRSVTYHVADNLQLLFRDSKVLSAIKSSVGYFVLTEVINFGETNYLYNPNTFREIKNWNKQVVSLVDLNFKVIWSIPLTNNLSDRITGLKYYDGKGLYLYGTDDRPSNGLLVCGPNGDGLYPYAPVGVVLNFNLSGVLLNKALLHTQYFPDVCSTTIIDVQLTPNNFFIITTEAGIKNKNDFLLTFIFDEELNFSGALYYEIEFQSARSTIGTGIPIYKDSFWHFDSYGRVIRRTFDGMPALTDGYAFYLFEDQLSQTYPRDGDKHTILINTATDICGIAPWSINTLNYYNSLEGFYSPRITSNGESILASIRYTRNLFQNSTDCSKIVQDGYVAIFNENELLYETYLSDIAGNDGYYSNFIISVGSTFVDNVPMYLVYTPNRIILLNEDYYDIYFYNYLLDQLYIDDLNGLYVEAVIEPLNSEGWFSILHLKNYTNTDSVLILK